MWGAVHGAKNVHHQYVSRVDWDTNTTTVWVIPYNVDINENAARTLDYSYNDWCIYQMGKKLNRLASEIDIYARRSLNYRNLYDKETGLMHGRNEDGTFQSPFNPENGAMLLQKVTVVTTPGRCFTMSRV